MTKLTIKVPAQTTTIDRDDLRIDITKMNSVVLEIETVINNMIKTLGNIKNEYNSLEKHFATNNYKKNWKRAVSNIEAETNKLKTRKKGLKTKYESDSNDLKVLLLDAKIAELEKAINAINGNNGNNKTENENNKTDPTKTNDSVNSGDASKNPTVPVTKTEVTADGQTKTTTSVTENGIRTDTTVWEGPNGKSTNIVSYDINTGKGTVTTTFPNGETQVQDI